MPRYYEKTDVVGVSETSIEDAIHVALREASKEMEGASWFEVKEIRGRMMEQGSAIEYQVTLSIGVRKS